MLHQRRILPAVLEAVREGRIALVEGPPRSGKSVFAAQVARARGGDSRLVEARGAEGWELARDPAGFLTRLGLGSRVGTLVVDEPGPGLAAALVGLAAGLPPRAAMVLVGGRGLAEAARAAKAAKAAPLPGAEGAMAVAGGAEAPAPVFHLGPFDLFEAGRRNLAWHWLVGGFPEALFAPEEGAAFAWLRGQAASLAGERFSGAGLAWAPERNLALLRALARGQGRPLNEAALARELGVSRPTVLRSVEGLAEAGLLLAVPAYVPAGCRKRLRRSGTAYLRDPGLLHALLGFARAADLLASPARGTSWAGYVAAELGSVLPRGYILAHYRSQDGAGLELVVLDGGGRPRAGLALRRGTGGDPGRGARGALLDLGLAGGWLVTPEGEAGRAWPGFEPVGLPALLELVAGLGDGA